MPRIAISLKELTSHVVDSFWLDLVYDEESKKPNHRIENLLHAVGEERNIPSLPKGDDPAYWLEHFKGLKAIRVLDGLDLDIASRDYADSTVELRAGRYQKRKYEALAKRANARRQNLDTITWRCSAAIDRILHYHNSANNERDTEMLQHWATLLALYHSELCASAIEEVSFGWALRSGFVLKEGAVGLPIFRWIANHNVSRGFNHMNRCLDAVKRLDTNVDEFDGKLNKLARDFRPEKDIVFLLYRLLYLPALLTLAQSLADLQRHSERRYYLQKGRALAATKLHSNYWREVFSLQLSLAEIDTGLIGPNNNANSEFALIREDVPPRVKQLYKVIENQAKEVNIKTGLRHTKSALSPQLLDDWRKSSVWLLRWNSTKISGLHRRLQATADFLRELLKLANKLAKNSVVDDLFSGRKQQMLATTITILFELRLFITFLVSNKHFKTKGSLKCLVDSTAHQADYDRPETWQSGASLLSCLSVLKEAYDARNGSTDLEELVRQLVAWREDLKQLLGDNERSSAGKTVYHQFRSEVEHLKLFPYDTPRTRICPPGSGNKGQHCHDYCAQRAMTTALKQPQVAKYQSYRWAMHSQQRRFLDYLKFRTARDRSFRAGEAPVRLPDFEFISLRRWNSFSPNLGSRAAASVGGGYLIRLWHHRRYLGIAVDPGYNFLENFFNEGFTIADIDIIVVTHAHPDHTENLTNLFTLLFERNKRMADEQFEVQASISAPIDHRVFLLLTEGVYERYESMLRETKSYVRDVVVLKAKEWRGCEASGGAVRVRTDDQLNCCIELDGNAAKGVAKRKDCAAVIQAKRAWHDDQTGHDSIGVVVKYWGKTGLKVIGILGDSRYNDALYLDYKECSVLVGHLGSLISKSYYKSMEEDGIIKPEEYINMIKNEDDLYLPGVTRLICDLRARNNKHPFPLLVLSEFGEELRGGLRKDLARRLAGGLKRNLPILPADVGLRIDIEGKLIFCSVCHRYLSHERISVESVLPNEEALAFVCDDCRLLRAGELSKLLEDWCTTGRPITQLSEKS